MTKWLGTWELIPELSHYSVGSPPDRGTYRIEQNGDEISFSVGWTDKGKSMAVTFAAPPDGRQVQSDFPGVESFSVLAEDDVTLSGDAHTGGKVVSKAMRKVSENGRLMSVLQENAMPETGWSTVFQVYERVDD